jgi:hypothetical protein
MKLIDKKTHWYWYEAESEYLGRDSAIFLVQVGSQAYKLQLRIDVVKDKDYDSYCDR